MKCNACGADMINTTGGNYHCSKCNFTVHDLVYRFQSCDLPLPENFGVRYGWICPRCGKVNSPDTRSCDCSSSGATITTSSTITVPDDIKISLTENTSNYRTQFNKIDTTDTDSIKWNYDPTTTLRNNR